jgi:hypothetical protein
MSLQNLKPPPPPAPAKVLVLLAIIAADEGGEGNLSCSPCGVYGRCVQYFATVESSSFLSYSFDQPTLACH